METLGSLMKNRYSENMTKLPCVELKKKAHNTLFTVCNKTTRAIPMNTVVVFLLLTLNKFLVPKGSFYTPRKHHVWYVFRGYGKEKRENFYHYFVYWEIKNTPFFQVYLLIALYFLIQKNSPQVLNYVMCHSQWCRTPHTLFHWAQLWPEEAEKIRTSP